METITEDYVSFETAKLLKEKGFLKGVDLRMTQNLSFYDNIGLSHNLNKYYDRLIQDKIDFVIAPTLQMAMKWLREKGIYITIVYGDYPFLNKVFWTPQIDSLEGFDLPIDFYKEYDKYEEAEEAGIKYALENLI